MLERDWVQRLCFYLGLGLITAATLMLQIIETRINSVTSWYHLVLQPWFAGCPSCSGGAKPCRVGAKPRTGLRSWRRLPGGLPRGSGVRSRADAPWLIFRACLLPWSG